MKMIRRDFLLGVSMFALAGTLPAQVFATPAPYVHVDSGAPIGKLELIERALDVGQKLGFTVKEHAVLFGLEPHVADNIAELRDVIYDYVVRYGSLDAWNRTRYLVAIYDQLKANHWNADNGVILDHLYVPDGRGIDTTHTLRKLMLFGQAGMHYVAVELGADIKEHSREEMRIFG